MQGMNNDSDFKFEMKHDKNFGKKKKKKDMQVYSCIAKFY